ncbi:MAG: aminotransferase class IV [Bacteroidia bacterium]|nr:aminotransferase class IV [Bacteroidia bacterium]
MKQAYCLLNGKLHSIETIQWTQNRAFRYGDGLFETVRVISGKPVFWDLHYQRLLRGLRILGIHIPKSFSESFFQAQFLELIEATEISEGARIRLQVWRSGDGLYSPNSNECEFLIDITPLQENSYHLEKDQKLTIYPEPLLHGTILTTIKSISSLPYIIAADYAKQSGYDDAIIVSTQKTNKIIAETSKANIFIVLNHELLTPSINSGCLPGIMRKIVLETAEALQIPHREETITQEMLSKASEVFTTNVVQGICPVRYIKGFDKTFSTQTNHITQSIFQFLLKLVADY